MRLWHKELIPVLPRQQLLSQWRECCCIAREVAINGTPNHILVNFVMDYSFDHFISYAYYVREEMTSRGYKTMDKVWNKIVSVAENNNFHILPFEEVYSKKMDELYLTICYYNLLEKYLCSGIEFKDWTNIQNFYQEKIDILKGV